MLDMRLLVEDEELMPSAESVESGFTLRMLPSASCR